MIDSDVSMRSHVSQIVSRCFAILHQICTYAAFDDSCSYLSLRRWSCCSSCHVYTTATPCLPDFQRLQSVLKFAARLIYRKSRCQHITPLLLELYWLWSREHVNFKLVVLIFRCLHSLAPRYLTDDTRRIVDINS